MPYKAYKGIRNSNSNSNSKSNSNSNSKALQGYIRPEKVISLWEPLGASGSLWEPLGASGILWEPLGASGTLWEPLGASGSLWEHLPMLEFLGKFVSSALGGSLGRPGNGPGVIPERPWVPLGAFLLSPGMCNGRYTSQTPRLAPS